MKITDGNAAKRVSGDHPRLEDGENGGHFGTEAEKAPRVKRAESVEAEMLAEETVPKFCLVLAEVSQQLLSGRARKEVESKVGLDNGSKFAEGELPRHLKRVDESKQILHDSGEKQLPVDGFKTEILRSGRHASLCGAVLYKENVVTFSRRPMALSSLQGVFKASKMFWKNGEFCRYAPRPKDTKKGGKEGGGVEKPQRVVEQ